MGGTYLDTSRGENYNNGRGVMSMFAKVGDKGQEVPGTSYLTGDYIPDGEGSHLRRNGTWIPDPIAVASGAKKDGTPPQVRVDGKFTPAAAMLQSGKWVSVANLEQGRAEVYTTVDDEGKALAKPRLLSVCTVSQGENTTGKLIATGDVEGNTTFSPAQAAAMLAYFSHPKNEESARLLGTEGNSNPLADSWGEKDPIALGDTMYMFMQTMERGRHVKGGLQRKAGPDGQKARNPDYYKKEHAMVAGCQVATEIDSDGRPLGTYEHRHY
jgi:hypothetical protein